MNLAEVLSGDGRLCTNTTERIETSSHISASTSKVTVPNLFERIRTINGLSPCI